MPNRQTRRAAAKTGLDVTLKVPYDGKVLDVDLMEFSAVDEDDFEHLTGMGFMGLIDLMNDMSRVRLRHIAALVWLHLRLLHPNVTYAEVAPKLTMRDITGIDVDDAAEATSPPA